MTKSLTLRQQVNAQTLVIASAAALSGAFDLNADAPRGLAIQTPTAWTAADIAFVVSADGTNYFPLYDDAGARVTISSVATGAAQVYVAPAEVWAVGAYTHMKLASIDTSTGANTNQAAERTLIVKALS